MNLWSRTNVCGQKISGKPRNLNLWNGTTMIDNCHHLSISVEVVANIRDETDGMVPKAEVPCVGLGN